MLKGKRFHYEGTDGQGGSIFSECTTDGERVTAVRVERAKPGKPVPLGQTMCHVRPTEDGDHVTIEEISAETTPGKGPAMVSSKEYRSGWDRIFGSEGVN